MPKAWITGLFRVSGEVQAVVRPAGETGQRGRSDWSNHRDTEGRTRHQNLCPERTALRTIPLSGEETSAPFVRVSSFSHALGSGVPWNCHEMRNFMGDSQMRVAVWVPLESIVIFIPPNSAALRKHSLSLALALVNAGHSPVDHLTRALISRTFASFVMVFELNCKRKLTCLG